jgi:serine/threonine protein kinase
VFDLLQRYGRLPAAWAAFFGASMCLALEHVHSLHIVFRDLKPENILVGMDGCEMPRCVATEATRPTPLTVRACHLRCHPRPCRYVILTDFGLAKHLEACTGAPHEIRRTTTVCGTPGYMAPEILRSEAYSLGVDWWAMGCVTYRMLAGNEPFPDADMAGMVLRIRKGAYDRAPLEDNSLASDLVARLLAVDVDARYSSRDVRGHATFAFVRTRRLTP